MSSSCIFVLKNNFEKFGIVVLNIVTIIAFTESLSKFTKIPNWLLVIPIAYIFYKLFCLDTIFFNEEKTGIVSRAVNYVQ